MILQPHPTGLLTHLLKWWRPVFAMTGKEWTQLRRDHVLLLFMLYAFTVDIYLAGSGVTLQVSHAATIVSSTDQGPATRELRSRLVEPTFSVKPSNYSPTAARDALDRGDAMLALDIPPRFSADVAAGRDTTVGLWVDTSNSVQGLLAASYVTRVVTQYSVDSALQRLGVRSDELPVIDNRVRARYNPTQNDAWFMSVSQLLNIITVFAILLPAAATVREKERGTVEQLLVSPLTPMQILLPKMLAMGSAILAAVVLSLSAVLRPIFHVPCQGSLTLFLALTVLYVFSTAGIGLFIATVARNLAQVGMLSVLILAPTLFLSGAWTPPEAMPSWLAHAMVISPLHHFIDIAFGILLKGQTAWLLRSKITALAIIGSILFGFGLARFRRQFA